MLFIIYLIGVVLSSIFALVNYLMYLDDNKIKHPHWLFYVNEVFWTILIIGGLSWIGLLFSIISIGNRFRGGL